MYKTTRISHQKKFKYLKEKNKYEKKNKIKLTDYLWHE